MDKSCVCGRDNYTIRAINKKNLYNSSWIIVQALCMFKQS